MSKVGGLLWKVSKFRRAVWVEWLMANEFSEEEARKRWSLGFGRGCRAEELYEEAQRAGWRYPLAQNLNRLEAMTERAEAALVRVRAEVYQAGGKLVRPVTVEVEAAKKRKTRIARMVPIDHAFEIRVEPICGFLQVAGR